MKVLITGATGLVGQKVVQKFLNEGHSVHILTRNTKKPISKNIKSFQWSNFNELPPKEAFNNVDCVINLMGENIGGKLWTKRQKEILYESRVLTTRKIVEQIRNTSEKIALINTSAIGVYPANTSETLTESSLMGTGFLSLLCHDWEKEALNLKPNRCVIVRTGIVLSTNGGALKKMLIPFKLGLGGVLGDGRQIMSWIHIDDLVNLYYQMAINSSFNGIYNATAPNSVSNRYLLKL